NRASRLASSPGISGHVDSLRRARRRLAEIRQGHVDPQRSGERSRQDLLEKDGTVPSRIVRELARRDVAVFAIEVGRLEAVARQDDLAAAARARLVLRGAEQSAADASVASRLSHPEQADFGDTTPGVTTEACRNSAIGISEKDHEPACIPNPGR